MKESVFYDILEKIENPGIKDPTNGYFPTIEEIEAHDVLSEPDIYLPIIAYFAQDPFTKNGISGYNTNEYKATVKYCKDLLLKFPLT